MEDDDPIRATLLAVKETARRGPISDEELLKIEKRMRIRFGGGVRYIAKQGPREERHRLICADLDAGMSVREVAKRHDVTETTVRRAKRDQSG
ncbi:MAG: hypothetical protein KDH15_19455 [Rhodocyclaceae bacterium]|nr:hypothetical protein [Rhodocyclaceae bacterium]